MHLRFPDSRDLVDALLELTIVGSFSRIGSAVRRRLDRWAPPPDDGLAGRTVLVTGPTSGLGRQVTDELAALGARIVLVGRNEERLNAVRDALVARSGIDRYPVIVADMGSLASVRAAADQVLATESRLDVLIDNAGAIFPDRTIGPDGIEATLATLVVGPFALIRDLLPLLDRTAGSRVIAVTSGGQYAQALDLDDLQSSRTPYDGTRAYARAKRAQVSLIREWARRFGGAGIQFYSMHPGWARTPGLVAALPLFARLMGPLLRTPAEGTDTLVWLATATVDKTDAAGGALWLDRRTRPFDRLPTTRLSRLDRHRLWDLVVALAGVADHRCTSPRTSRSHR